MSKKIILSHIVATSENNVIGFRGELPWHIPEDLRYFFDKTKHKILIMGRKSFDSLGKALPNRLNIVLSRQKDLKYGLSKAGCSTGRQNVLVFPNLDEALKYASKPAQLEKYGNEIFIGGGGEIYKQSLLRMDRLYITRIYKNYEGDAFYPEIPKDKFKLTSRLDRKGLVSFSFLVYEKIKS